jgi:hypothetical protein
MAELEMKKTHKNPGKSIPSGGNRLAEITAPSAVHIPAASGNSNRNNWRIALKRIIFLRTHCTENLLERNP